MKNGDGKRKKGGKGLATEAAGDAGPRTQGLRQAS